MTGISNGDQPSREDDRGSREEDDSWGDLAVDSEPRGEARRTGSGHRSSPPETLGESSRLDGLRLLVVDTDSERIEAARGGLEELGMRVADGGPDESGYLRALEFRPDVVLSDLTTPGEPGWWLFQRFRRQPLLKWTPVLLMRWWEQDPDGAIRVLLPRIAERAGEILAPIRVIEERIAAGRALADRVEVTGIPALLRLLCRAGLTGVLSVNDSWNVFEVTFAAGNVKAVVRRGVDGETDVAGEAFAQLQLCDAGRWSFRAAERAPRAENMSGDLDAAMDAASGLLAALFGPAATFGEESAERLGVRLEVMRDVASSLSGAGRELVETLAGGATPDEIERLLRSPADLVSAERALVSLMRCGAVRPFIGTSAERSVEAEGPVARSAAYMLGRIAEDHRASSGGEGREQAGGREPAEETGRSPGKGFYQVSKVTAERVALKVRESMNVPGSGFRPQVGRIDLTPADSAKLQFEAGAPTPVLEPDSMAWVAGLRSSTVEGPEADGPGAVMLHDSLVPAPPDKRDKGKRQMWVALALALILGGLLVIGLVIIGSDSPDLPGEIDRP